MATLHSLANAIQKLSAFVFISLGLLTKLFGQKHFLGMIFHGVSLGSTMRLDFPFERTPLLGRMLPLHLFTFMEQFDKIDRGHRVIIALSSTHTDSKRLMSLHEAIMKMMHLDCQDDRDRIYGTLGCIDWEGFTPIMPDYTITNYRLATALLQSQPPPPRLQVEYPDGTSWASGMQEIAPWPRCLPHRAGYGPCSHAANI